MINESREQAPLLTDGEPTDENDLERRKTWSFMGSDRNFLQRTWGWVRKRILMVALILLLIGGGIAVALYFHCMSPFGDKNGLRTNSGRLGYHRQHRRRA